jgi:hypothetical protein
MPRARAIRVGRETAENVPDYRQASGYQEHTIIVQMRAQDVWPERSYAWTRS